MPVMDEFKEERERMKSQPFKKRLAYFWEYHKYYVIGGLFAAFAVTSLVYSMVTAKDPALWVAMLDCYADPDYSEPFAQSVGELLEIDMQKEKVMLDTSYYINSQGNADAAALESLAVRFAAKELDIMLADEANFNRYSQTGVFYDLRDILSEEQFEHFKDSFYYVDQVVLDAEEYLEEDYAMTDSAKFEEHRSPDQMEEPIPVGIYVTGSEEFQNAFTFKEGPEVVFGIPVTSEHLENALEFLDIMHGIHE